ncbi:MAG TPA: type II CAAX endopeptidase family protein [Pyrinomonadaceae bacterium]|nr:type II CAAX endopeptidase family protein [Pyrinomonadaceae bacterium]
MDTPTDIRAGFDQSVGSLADESAPPAHADPAAAPAVAPAIDPDNPRWGILLGVALTIATFLFMLVVQIVFVVPYVLTRKTLDPASLEKILKGDKTVILLSVVSIFPAHLLTLALAWMIVTGFGKRPFWRSLGWAWSPRLGYLEAAACLGLTVLLLVTGRLLVGIFGDPETELERLILSSNAARYMIAAIATFTAPLVEEIVFRGVLYSGLRKRVGTVWGSAAVIAIFAAIHVPQYLPNVAAISTILLLSSVLTVVRARTGRLLPCVAIHFFFNGITSVLIVLAPYIQSKLPAPPPTPPTTPGALVELCAPLVSLFF